MNSYAKPVPAPVGRIGLRGSKEKAFAVAYSIVVSIAMIAWLTGFVWATIRLVKWLLV